jgi:pimeloyl-ACP methyl ester carboxylesterase
MHDQLRAASTREERHRPPGDDEKPVLEADQVEEVDREPRICSGWETRPSRLRRPLWTPALVQPLVAGIRGAESVVFDKSAHFANAEEPDRYREVLDSFLRRVEAGAR